MGFLDRFHRSAGQGHRRSEPAGIALPPRPVLPTEDDIVGVAEQVGLGRIGAELCANVRPSLRFDLSAVETTTSASTRMGGRPELPADVDWPTWGDRPLIFMAQLAMSELAGTPVADELPTGGLLSFWYAGSEKAWGFDPAERGAAQVLHIPPGAELTERATPAGMPFDGPLARCAWSPRPELMIPPSEGLIVKGWDLNEQELDQYFALQDWFGLGDDVTIHRLLGHPDPVQGDMQLECQLVTNGLYCGDPTGYEDPRRASLEAGAIDWRLLLQIDSDEVLGSEWGDTGRVYFWIRDQDRAVNAFGQTWHVMQCS